LIAVCCERTPAAVIAILGVLKAGAAYVPIDAGYPAERLAFLFDDTHTPLLLTDERVLGERPVSPAFLFAALLWHEVLAASKGRQARGERAMMALEHAMDEVLDTQCAKLAITRRLTATMREVWAMQPRFEQRSGARAYRLVEAPRFRMAYDFLALRAASGEVPADLEEWWRAFQGADAESRKAMLLPETGPRKRRRRRRKKPPGAAAAPEAA